MRNPYDVLGVERGADMTRVNAAYRELAKKYQGSNCAEMDEINAAYDAIVMQSSGTSGYTSAGGGYSYSYTGGADYSDIRAKINAHRLEDAQTLLDGIPEGMRNAEWYYLKGTVQHKKGWLEEAVRNFSTACSMDPGNNTYKMAYNKANQARAGGYRTEKHPGSNAGTAMCNLCSGLLCADTCCECLGCDLIPCC